MALLERDDQLGALRGALEAAGRNFGRTAWVTGEAGIGKTALVTQFAHDVGDRARVLWGTCEALFTPRPLGAFYDVVHDLGGPLSNRLEREAKPADLFHGLLDAVRTHDQPTVIALEDVHWADHATLDFIRFLARRIARLPALLICTYRDDEVGSAHPLPELLGEVPPDAQSIVKLSALSRATVDQLARESGRSDIDVYRITGGNPFFVSEVIAARSSGIAPTARQAVLARARRLSTAARELLDLVSVVPDRIELALLEGPLRADLGALEECAERGLLVLGQGHLSFKHELARIAIEGALSSVKRARLNRAMLEALETITGSPPNADILTRLAHHAIAADDGPAIVRLAPQAAQVASVRGAQHEAARLLCCALPHADRLPTPERAGLLERCARALFVVGASDEALKLYARAFEIRQSIADNTSKAHNLLAQCEIIFAGDIRRRREIAAMADEAVRLLAQRGASPTLALALMWQGATLARRDPVRARQLLGEALVIGEASAPPPVLVDILHRACHLEMLLMAVSSRERISRIRKLSLDNRLDQGLLLAWLHDFVGAFREYDLPTMRRVVDECLRYAADRQLERYFVTRIQQRHQVELDQHLGQWEDADRKLRQFEQGESQWAVRSALLHLRLAPMYLRWGRADGARWLEEMRPIEPELAPNEAFAFHRALVEQHWLADDLDAARAAAHNLARVATSADHPWVRGEAAFWQWVVGALDDVPDDVPEPYAHQLAGRWRDASAAWQRMGLPYETGLALVFGDIAAQREALCIFETLQARAAIELVRRRLHAQGVKAIVQGPRPSTRANAAQLTEREMEILLLLAAGSSNTEIARKWHRSVRTVENHVASLTAKLGADGRLAAVAIARERGLLPR